MGRPIHKKFFGNTNVPPLGGEGVASITAGGVNSGKTAVTPIVIAAPNLPGGTQAVARSHMELDSIVNFLAGTGYTVGDVLTLIEPGDAATVRATLTVTGITGIDPTGPIDTVSITTRGDYTALPTGTHPAGDITRYSVTGGTGSGADFNTTWKVKSVEVTTAGTGYTSAPSVTTQGGTTFTAALTSVNQNAIAISAYIPDGSSAVAGDIVKQEASRRYLVTTAQGTGQCKLVSAAPAAGEMTMTAVDSAGGTYYVTKLTAHRALLIKGDRTGTEFASGTSVAWSLSAAVLNERVQIVSA